MCCFLCQSAEAPELVICFLSRKAGLFPGYGFQPGLCTKCRDQELKTYYGTVTMNELWSEIWQKLEGAFIALRAADDLNVWSEELARQVKEEIAAEWIHTARCHYLTITGVTDQVDDIPWPSQEEIKSLIC